jgi:simple sugar transport system ATP-binding protein
MTVDEAPSLSVPLAPAAPLVELRGISKTFGATNALSCVDLAVRAGETHAIAGRNGAGKSTIVSIVTGLVRPDAGEIRFGGSPAPEFTDREGWKSAVACVYQRSTVIPELTVAENLFLNDFPGSGPLVKWRTMDRLAEGVLEEWQLDVRARGRAEDLSVGQRQLVEIARALRSGNRLIVLDEPTAQLEAKEIENLVEHMRRLQGRGVTFLFISHHLEEIYRTCDLVTVLRDGQVVATNPVSELPEHELVSAMVGGATSLEPSALVSRPPSNYADAPTMLEVKDLGVRGGVQGVTFAVRSGERLGIAGLADSGKLELTQAIAGMVKRHAGEVAIDGVIVPVGRVDKTVRAGLGYVPEDRHARGFCPTFSTEQNVTMSVLSRMGRGGWLSRRRVRDEALRVIGQVGIEPSSPSAHTSKLSGGNQQKSVVGRALATNPKVLLLVNPTQGVDIASKSVLFELLENSSAAVVIASDELDELAMCDRVIVMYDGVVTAELGPDRTDHQLVAAIEGVNV